MCGCSLLKATQETHGFSDRWWARHISAHLSGKQASKTQKFWQTRRSHGVNRFRASGAWSQQPLFEAEYNPQNIWNKNFPRGVSSAWAKIVALPHWMSADYYDIYSCFKTPWQRRKKSGKVGCPCTRSLGFSRAPAHPQSLIMTCHQELISSHCPRGKLTSQL